LLVFIAGAIVYQAALFIFAGTVDYAPEKGAVEMSGDLIQERFHDECEFLASKKCGCDPLIRTDRSCKDSLRSFMLDKYLKDNQAAPNDR
jgi:hypothetical protein